ncbi:MAG TPA: GNAT family N-acetyltransferase [Pseudolabrys sp.]|nr:GNAT family N-acetyltransferase [Pseudolabrys sp.]
MTEAMYARVDAMPAADTPPAGARTLAWSHSLPAGVSITVHDDLSTVANDWRAFEREADGTIFQAYEWLSTWQRCIGGPHKVRPAIVVGRDAAGSTLFLFPLSVRKTGFGRELRWLGSDLCDYNGPLLAHAFSAMFDEAAAVDLWRAIEQRVQQHPGLGFDSINMTKMPATIGAQPNPLRGLVLAANPSGAYRTALGTDWETFYSEKRSSATRRRDRTKRKRLADFGDVRMVNTAGDDTRTALDTLMAQKARAFAHMGVANLFANPGYTDFYRALIDDPSTRPLVHISRLDVGLTPAAVNLGLVWRGCYYHLLASYTDGEIMRFGPGAAHLHELMNYAIENGCSVFDFTIGDESYKRDWCGEANTLYDYIAAVTWRGALAVGPMIVKQRVKRWIKQTPIVWNVFSHVRALIGSLARRPSVH